MQREEAAPAADEQTFIINKEDYLIKPCSLQLSISLLVLSAGAGDMNQMVTSCNLQWPNWPTIHAGKLNVTLHWIEECQSS